MGNPCRSYWNQNLQTYEKECARELNSKTKKIEDLNIQVSEQNAHLVETSDKYCYYYLKKEIEN